MLDQCNHWLSDLKQIFQPNLNSYVNRNCSSFIGEELDSLDNFKADQYS